MTDLGVWGVVEHCILTGRAAWSEILGCGRLRESYTPLSGGGKTSWIDQEKSVSCDAERCVVVKASPTSPFVSAGIDLALWLAGEIAGRERAEAIQLAIEYDPHPPFDAGHLGKASRETQRLAKEILGHRMPVDQRRLVHIIHMYANGRDC